MVVNKVDKFWKFKCGILIFVIIISSITVLQHLKLRHFYATGLGSQAYLQFLAPSLSICETSSSVSLKFSCMFSLILCGVVDLGMTATPLCRAHANRTWAEVALCFCAMSTTTRSSINELLLIAKPPKEQYA